MMCLPGSSVVHQELIVPNPPREQVCVRHRPPYALPARRLAHRTNAIAHPQTLYFMRFSSKGCGVRGPPRRAQGFNYMVLGALGANDAPLYPGSIEI